MRFIVLNCLECTQFLKLRPQDSRIALWVCSLHVFVIAIVIGIAIAIVIVIAIVKTHEPLRVLHDTDFQ